ncbi:MAG: hypothetical protein L6R36_006381 [Xanthoria steineri]|nr:MAG: hypothetical protein L6R36_006381 [Xanthoria steineri]
MDATCDLTPNGLYKEPISLDLWETLSPAESKAMLKRFMPIAEGKIQPVATNPYEQILYDLYAKLRAVDEAPVETMFREMAVWALAQVDQERKQCKGMGALLELRQRDSAAGWVAALMAYAMGLHLLPSERASIIHIEKAYAYLAIIDNEIESYDKEVAASGKNGVVNLVQMQADDTGCSIAASKRILWVLYRELQLEFLELVAKREASAEGCSETLKSYMKGLDFQASHKLLNNMYWQLPIILLGMAHPFACSPAAASDHTAATPLVHARDLANPTSLTASIPPEFQMYHELELPIRFPPEACFLNIIAALADVALHDFAGKVHITSYRTTRFPEPFIRMNSPGLDDVKTKFMVWGLFLMAFYIHTHDAFQLGFFSLQWKGAEVAGLGIAGTPRLADTVGATPLNNNAVVKVDFAFYGGPLVLGKGSVFMTIIMSLQEAAPQGATDGIYETVINYLPNEPAAFIVTPTRRARRSRGPSFTNAVLIDALARTAEFYAASNIYRQLDLNISVGGVKVAQAAFVQRRNLEALNLLNATDLQEHGLQTT